MKVKKKKGEIKDNIRVLILTSLFPTDVRDEIFIKESFFLDYIYLY